MIIILSDNYFILYNFKFQGKSLIGDTARFMMKLILKLENRNDCDIHENIEQMGKKKL